MRDITIKNNNETFSHPAIYKETYLSWVFVGYLYLLLFLGRFPEYQQSVIWVFGPLFVVVVLVSYLRRPFKLPKEIIIYVVFWLWTLTGYLIAIDLGPYFRYFRLIFTVLILIICSQIVIRKTGSIRSIFKVYIFIGLSYFFYDIISGEINANLINQEGWRYGGLLTDSNWNAFMAFTAITGVVYFWKKTMKFSIKLLLIILIGIFFTNIIFSASRGGFVTTMVFFTVWFLLFKKDSFKKHKLLFIGLILLLYPLLIFSFDFLIANTFLGERFSNAIGNEALITDEKRIQLYIQAFDVFWENPFVGIGLSQFLVFTNYVAFTHSDYMELLSTTGIVGFSLMMTFYIMIFVKIIKLKRKLNSEVLIQRLNLFIAIIIAIWVYGFFMTNFISIVSMLQFSVVSGYVNYLESKHNEYILYRKYENFKAIKGSIGVT